MFFNRTESVEIAPLNEKIAQLESKVNTLLEENQQIGRAHV